MGFSVIRTPTTWEFKVNWSAATVRLSRYVTYENGSREFRLFLPAGMAVYWIMKKRLDRESVHKKHENQEPGPENRADQEPGPKKRADQEPGPEKRADRETRQEQRPDADRGSWRIP